MCIADKGPAGRDAEPLLMISIRRLVVVAALAGLFPLAAGHSPTLAVTGGAEDTSNTYSSVGVVLFYVPGVPIQPCSGTLIAKTVVLTAGHCTVAAIGKVAVTFDPEIARTVEQAATAIPRAADEEEDGTSLLGFEAGDITAPKYVGDPDWFLGTPMTHPGYGSDGIDTGVVILDKAPGLRPSPLAPENYLDQFTSRTLKRTGFLTVGYGTEVRKPDEGPQAPTPTLLPFVRRYTTEAGQQLSSQTLYVSGNDRDSRAGGGICFGDSGGPALHRGYVVGGASIVTSNQCRSLAGFQRVDTPVVRNWLVDCLAGLACPTNP